jgi:hypothetical protein
MVQKPGANRHSAHARHIASSLRKSVLQDEIQFEHIDLRFAKNTQAAADQILLDQRSPVEPDAEVVSISAGRPELSSV